MRRHLAVLSITAASFLVAQPANAITFGTFDGALHPNVGAVLIPYQGAYSKICSGTLIAPEVFLTAQHCLDSAAPDDYFVTFDPTFGADSELIPGVAHFDPLAYQGGFNDPHDIGVILLEHPVSIAPAVLPTKGLLTQLKANHRLDSQVFTAVGYGQVRETKRTGPHALARTNERRYVTQSPLSLQKAWFTLSMNPSTGSGGTCFGDSGGPHFLGGPKSNLIVSITVTGDSMCRATDKTYRIDTASARSFLADFVDLP